MKKIGLFGIVAVFFLVSIVPFQAASGQWTSGQQYDFNGLNSCHSTNNTSTFDFDFKVWDEYHVELGAEEKTLGDSDYYALENSGFVGSKECVIDGSSNHSPGFNS